MKRFYRLAVAGALAGFLAAITAFFIIAPYWFIAGQAQNQQNWANTYLTSVAVGLMTAFIVVCLILFESEK